ncbi:MAG: hypothetical protein AAGD35_05695 [Actinomycetota bacterium]
MIAWTDTAGAVSLDVRCGGEHHRVHWSEGRFLVSDHPDLDAELALIGFGGAEPRCLWLRRLWLDAVNDGGFLAEWVDESHLSPARLSWMTMALERMASEGFHEFLRDLPRARAERMGRFLSDFPRPWLDRAAAAVSASVADGDGVACTRAPFELDAAAAVRLRRAFVEAVGGSELAIGAAALVPLDLTVAPDAASTADGRLDGTDRGVSLGVDRRWLHEVWAAGAAVVDGHLILGRTDDGLAVVHWDAGRPTVRWRRCAVEGGRWRLDPAPTSVGQASSTAEGSC